MEHNKLWRVKKTIAISKVIDVFFLNLRNIYNKITNNFNTAGMGLIKEEERAGTILVCG